VSDATFPSGPWTGFYNYSQRPGKHRMDLGLTFANGRICGEGNDDIGRFVIRGGYETKSRECYWTKTYVGGHDVFYHGFGEDHGIWGTWEIPGDNHGGFRIWPKAQGEDEGTRETEEEEVPCDAVAGAAV